MTKKKKEYTGIKDVNGKKIYDGDIVMSNSKVYWNEEKGMWAISNGKYPLGEYKYREDFVKECK